MTVRRLIHLDAEELTEIAFNTRGDIEIGDGRAWLRHGDTTYVAELTDEVTC